MAKTSIEWTDYSWPVINGCRRKSAGCVNCYAERLASTRLRHTERYRGLATYTEHGPRWTGESRLDRAELAKPLSWKSPRRVFVCDMGDLFYEGNSFEQIAAVYGVIASCPQHSFQVLTKRAERMVEFYEWLRTESFGEFIGDTLCSLTSTELGDGSNESRDKHFWNLRNNVDGLKWPLPNLHLGVSVENQAAADERIPLLLQCPAAVRWVSAEPLLSGLDLRKYLKPTLVSNSGERLQHPDPRVPSTGGTWEWGLDWVVVGGESGSRARPMHPDWARSLRDQCRSAGVPYFFKQFGEYVSVYDRDAEDPDWRRCSSVSAAGEPGQWINLAGGMGFHGERVQWMGRVGKKRAGNLLDGVRHEMRPGDKWP